MLQESALFCHLLIAIHIALPHSFSKLYILPLYEHTVNDKIIPILKIKLVPAFQFVFFILISIKFHIIYLAAMNIFLKRFYYLFEREKERPCVHEREHTIKGRRSRVGGQSEKQTPQ